MPLIFSKDFSAKTIQADMVTALMGAIDELAAYFEQEVLTEINEGKFPGIVGTGLVYRGALKQNLRREIDEPLLKIIVSDTPYSAALNFGRLPGKRPPIAPLQKWFEVKLHLTPDKARQAAWTLSEKMLKFGLEARPFFTRAATKASSESVVKTILKKYGFE